MDIVQQGHIMVEMREHVITMQRKVHDLMDYPNDPVAQRLKVEVQGLEDDLQVKKHARTIEDRVKRIIHILEHEAKEHRIMNYEHIDMFRHQFEHLRDEIRRIE